MIILVLGIIFSVYSFTCNGTVSTDPDTCNGGGECLAFNLCACYSGRKGTFCEDYVQGLVWPYDTSGNSICTYTGTATDACSGTYEGGDPRHGLCIPGENRCFCVGNSLGSFCDYYQCGNRHILNPMVCSGHGVCNRVYADGNTVLDTPCACAVNYTGMNCEQAMCFGVLGPSACTTAYRGQCLSKDVCTCRDGFYGERCQWKDCPAEWGYPYNICYGRGHCTDNSIGSEYSEIYCVCDEGVSGSFCERCGRGWTGDNCTELDCSGLDGGYLKCNGHGYCVDYSSCSCYGNWAGPNCTFCLPGYTGENCTEIVCAINGTNCTGHGQCNGPYTCQCESRWTDFNCDKCDRGYTGDSCASLDCSPTSPECSGHGSCIDMDTCECNGGFEGIYCQFEIHVPDCESELVATTCNGHGNCITLVPLGDVCNCTEPWDGDFCTQCHVGYTGENCDQFECHPLNNDTLVCSGHGNCIGPMVCNCTRHYTGRLCETCIDGYDECIVPALPLDNLVQDQSNAVVLIVGLIVFSIITWCFIVFAGILLYQKLVVFMK